ncbi:unnamed protein product, partial [Brassica oleracea var. botrytis]
WLGSEGPHCLSLRSCGYETIPFSISSPFRSLCFSRLIHVKESKRWFDGIISATAGLLIQFPSLLEVHFQN